LFLQIGMGDISSSNAKSVDVYIFCGLRSGRSGIRGIDAAVYLRL
jgi:hypothetical protein